MRITFKVYGILVLVLLQAFAAHAKRKDSSKVRRVPPKYILVQLSTETNRMNALEKAGRMADLETLKKDAAIVRANMIKDFTENFNYCPVYFFMDTDNPAVVNRKFDVLLDKDMKKVQNVPITDTNYLIVYFGIPAWQTRERKLEPTTQSEMGGQPYGEGLIYCNHEMEQVGYVYELRISLFQLRSRENRLVYESRKFNISYRAIAEDFDKRMKQYAKQYARKYKLN